MKTALVVAVLGVTLPALARAQDTPSDPSTTLLLDGLSWELAVSGYYRLDTAFPPNNVVPPEENRPPYRAFARNHGFGLTFVNADASYATDRFGLTINLRFGQGQDLLSPGFTPALNNLKQGFVTWKPSSALTFDLGWFDTIYGAEVSEEWKNLNFTRGAIFFLQPFNHMGLRIGVQATDRVTLKFLVVNGYGVQIDNDDVPNIGAQVSLTPLPDFDLTVGYFSGSTEPDNRNWNHFFDVVATYSVNGIDLVFNGNFRWDPNVRATSWDVMGGVGIPLTDVLKGAVRVELFADDEGLAGLGADLLTVTATLRYTPVDNLIISLDNRLEHADRNLFFGGNGVIENDANFTTTLGLTALIGS